MRLAIRVTVVLLFLVAAACRGADCERGEQDGQATFVDSDGDGLPDQRAGAR